MDTSTSLSDDEDCRRLGCGGGRPPLLPPPRPSWQPRTARQLVDQLSDHLGVYHAAMERAKESLEQNQTRSAVLKFFEALSTKQRAEVLTCADESACALLYAMSARAASCGGAHTRFLVLDDLPSASKTKTKAAKGGKRSNKKSKGKKAKRKASAAHEGEGPKCSRFSALIERAQNALVHRKSSACYGRILGSIEQEATLVENAFLFAANASDTFTGFSVTESVVESAEGFFDLCSKISMGKFLSSCKTGKPAEATWLSGMGYYTMGAYLVSRFEVLLLKAYSCGHHGGQSANCRSSREGLAPEQQRLCQLLCSRCLLQQAEPSSQTKLFALAKQCCTHVFVVHGKFFLGSHPDPILDEMALVAEKRALTILTSVNEQSLLLELESENHVRHLEEEKTKKPRCTCTIERAIRPCRLH